MHQHEPISPLPAVPAPGAPARGVIVAELVPEPPIRVVPSPGFWESLGWTVGLWVSIVAFALVGGAAAGAASTSQGGGEVRSEDIAGYVLMLGSLGTGAFALLASWIRTRPGWAAGNGLRRPFLVHAAFPLLAVVPLLTIAFVIERAYEQLSESIPSLKQDELEQMLLQTLSEMPLWFSLVAIAVLPAMGEELLFRGFIGRGLVGRWGPVRGVLATSLLFAIAHLNPAQFLWTFPLGIVLHVSYLASRSLWVPILLHCCNNALAVMLSGPAVLEAFGTQLDLVAPLARPSAVLLMSAALTVALLLLLLRRTRASYETADGVRWDPGYVTGEAPPQPVQAVRVRRRASPVLVGGVVASVLGFGAAFFNCARPAPGKLAAAAAPPAITAPIGPAAFRPPAR